MGSYRIQSFLLLKISEYQGVFHKRVYSSFPSRQAVQWTTVNAFIRGKCQLESRDLQYPSNYVAEGADSTVPKTHLRLHFSGIRVACRRGSEGDLHGTLQAPKTHFYQGRDFSFLPVSILCFSLSFSKAGSRPLSWEYTQWCGSSVKDRNREGSL